VVDSRDILEYRGFLQQQGRTPATINRRLNALRKFFRWAKQQEPAVDNPFDILETVFIKQQQDTAPGWLKHKEQLALLRAVRERGLKRDLAIVQTMLGTGLRISELVALEVVDLEISDRRAPSRFDQAKE
jgi:integrase/recombinase XerD